MGRYIFRGLGPRAFLSYSFVDKALAEVMADGTYERISKKYMNEDIRCR